MTQNANISISIFLQFCNKKLICIFCIFIFMRFELELLYQLRFTHLAPQNHHLNLSIVKDENTVGENMARNGHKTAIYQLLFFRELAKSGNGNICILCHNF